MKKNGKRLLWIFLTILLLAFLGMGTFIYKAAYGLPFYDHTPPELPKEMKPFAVLNFNKTNGFRHASAIEVSTKKLEEMAAKNQWTLFSTDNAAVFNQEQLAKFDVVIWNNATGRNLTDEQRTAFQQYMDNGGGFLGIHGAGDFSHQWKWYEHTLIGADFSHHPLSPQIQAADLFLECDSTSSFNCHTLPQKWTRSDEWYIFFNNPREKDFTVLYTVDESKMKTSGNIPLLATDKDFGMGEDHPIIWYKCLPNGGRTFYSALGHDGAFFEESQHLTLLKEAILWTGKEGCLMPSG